MSTPKISPRAKPHEFQFATTHRSENGFEFVIAAKSRDDLKKAWIEIAGPIVPFDETKIDRVEIRRG